MYSGSEVRASLVEHPILNYVLPCSGEKLHENPNSERVNRFQYGYVDLDR